MKKIAEIVSYLSLVMIVLAPILFYVGQIALATNKTLMLVATALWFISALCWMGRDNEGAHSVEEV